MDTRKAMTLAARPIDLMIFAKWILPVVPQGRVLRDCCLAVDKGLILGIHTRQEAPKLYQPAQTVELPEHVLMPGLINAHGHAAMSLLRGFADDLPLSDWLQNHIWPAEARWVSNNFVRDGAELAIAEMLRSGTTCFSDMYFFPEATAAAAQRAGMRAQVAFPILDFPTAWGSGPDDYIHKGIELRDNYKSSHLISIGFGPHAPYTVSDEPLQRVATLAEELQAPIQIHLHETAGEVEDAVKASGVRPIERLNNLGLLSPLTQCVHMTQLTDEDIDLVASTGASVIHCPESNLKLASGLCPVQKLIDANINVALGTDGAASNNDLDMFGEMRTAALVGKLAASNAAAVSADTAVYMATLGGAKALGLDHCTGSLEPGKAADVIAVRLDDIESIPLFELASQLVYTASGHKVTHSWVNGKMLMRERQLLTLSVPEITAKIRQWQYKLEPLAE
jgi:5-methylthioadenosine/S-adenosylhomocysteine deaminase